MSSGANFSILSVIFKRSSAGASLGIQGLQSVLIMIFSPIICLTQKYREGIGEYTRSLPQVRHRITEDHRAKSRDSGEVSYWFFDQGMAALTVYSAKRADGFVESDLLESSLDVTQRQEFSRTGEVRSFPSGTLETLRPVSTRRYCSLFGQIRDLRSRRS